MKKIVLLALLSIVYSTQSMQPTDFPSLFSNGAVSITYPPKADLEEKSEEELFREKRYYTNALLVCLGRCRIKIDKCNEALFLREGSELEKYKASFKQSFEALTRLDRVLKTYDHYCQKKYDQGWLSRLIYGPYEPIEDDRIKDLNDTRTHNAISRLIGNSNGLTALKIQRKILNENISEGVPPSTQSSKVGEIYSQFNDVPFLLPDGTMAISIPSKKDLEKLIYLEVAFRIRYVENSLLIYFGICRNRFTNYYQAFKQKSDKLDEFKESFERSFIVLDHMYYLYKTYIRCNKKPPENKTISMERKKAQAWFDWANKTISMERKKAWAQAWFDSEETDVRVLVGTDTYHNGSGLKVLFYQGKWLNRKIVKQSGRLFSCKL